MTASWLREDVFWFRTLIQSRLYVYCFTFISHYAQGQTRVFKKHLYYSIQNVVQDKTHSLSKYGTG